jgi:hypothetical protein
MMRTNRLRIIYSTAILLLVALIAILEGCGGVGSAPPPPPPPPPAIAVTTYHNDIARTGANLNETVLTPANVNATQFGKLFWFNVDGMVFAQPLYLQNVSVPGRGTMNLVFAATEHDSVYAFDADGNDKDPVWKVSFLQNGATTVTQAEVDSTISPEIGITGTPVIDPARGTLYVVALTKESGNYVQRLHALNIATGDEQPGSPVVIAASVNGSGTGSNAGTLAFDPKLELQRAALLLANGNIYIAWASHGDNGNYHGWVIACNAQSLQQVGVWNDTPDAFQGGIWMGGGGLSADAAGNIYGISGNGQFDVASGGRDYGDTFFKLSPDLSAVTDWFTPFNEQAIASVDADLGSGDALLVPDQPGPRPHLIISAGKEGRIYVLDRDNMGHFHSGDDSQIVQSIPNALGIGTEDRSFSSPAYWNGTVYFVGANGDNLKAFPLTNGQLGAPVRSATTYGFHGATPAISASGNTNGIVWTIETTSDSLHAHDAGNVAQELYNSNQDPGRDGLGTAVRFSVPTVANGKVYVGTTSAVVVYGLLK